MTNDDAELFAVHMVALSKSSRVPLDERDMRMYFEACVRRGVTIAQLDYAVRYSIDHFDGMPRPAKLIEFALAMPRPITPPSHQIPAYPASSNPDVWHRIKRKLSDFYRSLES